MTSVALNKMLAGYVLYRLVVVGDFDKLVGSLVRELLPSAADELVWDARRAQVLAIDTCSGNFESVQGSGF